MAKMTGAQAIARMLEDYGVTHIFHVPAILRRTMVELEASTSIKRVRTHGEKSAAYMADGYARASRRPGICMAQTVGALNLAAGLRDAWLAHSPVIALTGGRDPATKFRKVYQQNDDVPVFDAVTKFNATVDSVERFPDMVRQAFRVAVSGTPGPVHLQFRGNEGQMDVEEADMEPLVEAAFSQVPPFRPEPDDASVKKAVELLQAAKRPVIVAGGGVRWSDADPAVVALAEKLHIPVATSLNGKDSIPGTHPLSVGVVGTYSRGSANQVVMDADLVCFIGTETGGMTTHFWKVPKLGTRAIQIDIDPEALGRNYMLDAAVLGDAKVTIERMVAHADASTAASRTGWVRQARRHVGDWYQKYSELLSSEEAPTRPERICSDLSKHLPEDAFVVVDTGHAGMWMGGMFDLQLPTQSYIRCAGHLGWAFSASIGAQCGVPDRPVVCFTGDGGFLYHVAEIETAVRWNIPVVIVVNNNHSGNQSKLGYDQVYGGKQTEQAQELWVWTDVNIAKVAETFGAQGLRVEKPSEFAPALEKAIASRRTTIIDVVTDMDAQAPLPIG
ncbi:MAG: thiamine pyrophosphate-binding protein [Rhodospirillaceae bacterium]|jgi:acetolactate synthase I/II/III large subunit|nr:thiamine pyrophosphate-binding protein [Rhodospirillaceae bacterium]